ncbi:peptidase [Pseudomonas citronellolis]|uniref:Type II secretion system protein H n=2 Tax=Pseudomonas citronellolis TaxID=53408 RepID=A0A1A9KLG6_9PSED|nr:peptidase [Pseudomonas citronellolis]
MAGFTLIELMFTIVILAILISIAAPSFTSSIRDSRIATASTELQGALQLARSEAVMRRSNVILCRRNSAGDNCENGTDWSTGWLIRQSGGDIIKVWQSDSNLSISGPNTGVTFQGNGLSTAAANFAITQSSCTGQQKRTISVLVTGAAKLDKKDC